MHKITPFLWYDGNVQEAIDFYRGVFPGTTVVSTIPGPGGAISGATVEIEGQRLILFNGGPHHKFTPAISLYVDCRTQEEVDRLWSKLLEGGGREDHCGWLQDRFGLSWQIVPAVLPKLLADPDREKAQRALQAMLGMKKIDIGALERAAA